LNSKINEDIIVKSKIHPSYVLDKTKLNAINNFILNTIAEEEHLDQLNFSRLQLFDNELQTIVSADDLLNNQINLLEEKLINSKDLYDYFLLNISTYKEMVSLYVDNQDFFLDYLDNDLDKYEYYKKLISSTSLEIEEFGEDNNYFIVKVSIKDSSKINETENLLTIIMELSNIKNNIIIEEYLLGAINIFKENTLSKIKDNEQIINSFKILYAEKLKNEILLKKEFYEIANHLGYSDPFTIFLDINNKINLEISEDTIDGQITSLNIEKFPFLKGYKTLKKEIDLLKNRDNIMDYVPEIKSYDLKIEYLKESMKNNDIMYNKLLKYYNINNYRLKTVSIGSIISEEPKRSKYGYEIIILSGLLGFGFSLLLILLLITNRNIISNKEI
ncbi:MAG: hypothetical protein CBB97_00900, partial [Candidatus Endolissoclinum sp. TMED37]